MNETIDVQTSWGGKIPDRAKRAPAWWSARAIFRDNTIDILPDRQEFKQNGGDSTRALQTWINEKALPYLRRLGELRRLPLPNMHDEEEVWGEGHRLTASPRASCGYLYIHAWTSPEDTNPFPPLPTKPARRRR